MIVVKVGGSLYDLPDLKQRLNRFLQPLAVNDTVIVVSGGGAMADVVRDWDRTHGLGNMASHRMAIETMSISAFLLYTIIENAHILYNMIDAKEKAVNVYNVRYECVQDADEPTLPESWDVTSDSIAARVAILSFATRLILLKSTDLPTEGDWYHAADMGIVDRHFPTIIRDFSGTVEIVNLRTLSFDKEYVKQL